jgi:hypothetical protein
MRQCPALDDAGLCQYRNALSAEAGASPAKSLANPVALVIRAPFRVHYEEH